MSLYQCAVGHAENAVYVRTFCVRTHDMRIWQYYIFTRDVIYLFPFAPAPNKLR